MATVADTLLLALLVLCGLLFLLVASLWSGRPSDVAISRYRRTPLAEWEIDPLEVLSDVAEMVECGTYRAAYNYLRSLNNWFYSHRFLLPPEFASTWMIVLRRLTRIVSLEAYPQDWSQREIGVMRREILSRISSILNTPSQQQSTRTTQVNTAAWRGSEGGSQSWRYISAPKARSRSSNRS